MKFLNDFKNIFTVLGIVSIIFWTCSSESVLKAGKFDGNLIGTFYSFILDKYCETRLIKSFSFLTFEISSASIVIPQFLAIEL